MRIGLIRMRYTPYGGAEVFLSRFITELRKRGHTLDLFSTDWKESEGMRLHRINAAGPKFLRPLLFANAVKKAVEKASPGIVVSLERTDCQDIYRAGDGCHKEWLIQRARAVTPVKRFFMKLSPLHRTILALEKRLFTSPRLKMVVANSRRVKDEIIRHYGLPEDKICVIYNGVNLADFSAVTDSSTRLKLRSELGVTADATVILYVGSGFERKGLLYLIRAVKRLKELERNIKLLVIGKGRTQAYLKEAARLGLANDVIFKGAVKDAVRYYGAADIFALPSIYEPFSNACLEAMAAGLPVVTSRVNGASEVITEPVNGAVVEDPTDSDELARKIAVFLDRGVREKAGAAAREEAVKHPIEKNVSEFLGLMEKMIKG